MTTSPTSLAGSRAVSRPCAARWSSSSAGISKSFGTREVLHGDRPHRPHRRARRHLRALGLGQVDAAAHDQPARGARRGLGAGPRRRVRPRRRARRAPRQRARAPAPGRHGLPAVQPVPAPDGAREHRAAAAGGAAPRRGEAEERAARGAQAGRAAALGRPLPGRALGRPAAARRDRPRAQPRSRR